MRSDMWKVIVERPRLGRGHADAVGRRARKLAPGDLDGSALGCIERSERTKSLNENLAPLRRYLERQVGRRWDAVYSEMRAQISFDNVVQKHVFAHLEQFLWRNVRVVDGFVWSREQWSSVPRRGGLFVDPSTNLIRRLVRTEVEAPVARSDLVELGPRACLCSVGGVWFHVVLAPMPARITSEIDVVTRRAPEPTSWIDRHNGIARYGQGNVYAIAKRQLGKRELRAHRAAGRM